jgi:ABC-type Fe3+/spermidine/putrescine transport system ATPase subunit
MPEGWTNERIKQTLDEIKQQNREKLLKQLANITSEQPPSCAASMTHEQCAALNAIKSAAVENSRNNNYNVRRQKWRANLTPKKLAEFNERERIRQINWRAKRTQEQIDAYNAKERLRKGKLRAVGGPWDEIDIDNIDVDNLNIPDNFDFDDDVVVSPQKRKRTYTRRRQTVKPVSPPHTSPPTYPSPPHDKEDYSDSDFDIIEYFDDPAFKSWQIND